MAETVKDTEEAWCCKAVGKRNKRGWKIALICTFWTIWKQRTNIGTLTIAFQSCNKKAHETI